MTNHRVLLLPLAVLAIAATTSAQLITHESLTKWTRDTSASTWNAGIADPSAEFAIVDELTTGTVVKFSTQTTTLGPGTYIVSARVMKTVDVNGAADMTIEVDYAGSKFTNTLAAADQTANEWIRVPYVTWTQTVPAPVTITFGNTDVNITKLNYRFDSAVLGHVEAGDLVHYQSLYTWNHDWGRDPRYSGGEIQEPESADGNVNHLLSVWWLLWHDYQVDLAPGTYTANARFKKLAGGTSADMKLTVKINGATYTQTTRLRADQTADTWVDVPAAVFTVKAGDIVKFDFGNTQGFKAGYHYDSFTIQKGVVEYYGEGCASSTGIVKLHRGNNAQIGQPFTMFASNMQNGFLGIGTTRMNVDLSVVGMNGCWLLSSMDATLPMTTFGLGNALSTFNIPANTALVGSKFLTQAVAIDPAANALGIVTSNAATHDIVQ